MKADESCEVCDCTMEAMNDMKSVLSLSFVTPLVKCLVTMKAMKAMKSVVSSLKP